MMANWHTISLGKVVTFQRGYDLPNHARKEGTIPIVSSAGVTDYHNAPMVAPPGVVTGRYGTIGKVFFITEAFWPLNTTLYVRDFHGNDPSFVYYLLQRFDFRSFSGKSGVPGVNRNDLHVEVVTLPLNAEEQRAIAEALSDVDALLAALDRLITKQRDRKQAAMQQLLTGQTRLPGFAGAWEVKRLGEICSMKSGDAITSANIDQFSMYPCYGGNGIRGFTSRFTHDGSYVLIGRQGALCGNVFVVNGRFFASEHAVVVTASTRTDTHWLTYVLEKMNLNQYSESSAQPGLSVSKILNLDLIAPPTKAEQTAIAAVLSDMDAELAALEQRRDKTRLLKQGMMQELLTGRTRLVR